MTPPLGAAEDGLASYLDLHVNISIDHSSRSTVTKFAWQVGSEENYLFTL